MPQLKAFVCVTHNSYKVPLYCLMIYDVKRAMPGVSDLEKLAIAEYGNASKADILKIAENKNIPIVKAGKINSVIKDSTLSVDIADEMATIFMTRAKHLENLQKDARKEHELNIEEKEKRTSSKENSVGIPKYFVKGTANVLSSFLWQPLGNIYIDMDSAYQQVDNFFFINKVTHTINQGGCTINIELLVNY